MRKALALVLVAACSKEAPPAAPPSTREAPPAPRTEKTGAITWIEDDYPAALAIARERKIPIVIDMWAQWCHTCLSMQAYVFPDPAFAPLANRFVWLAIDTEQRSNADVVAKFTPEVWPTFFLVDPVSESLVGKWVGSGSVEQMATFLTQTDRGLLVDADRAAAARRYPEAAALYAKALAAAPSDWRRRPDALVGQILALWRSDAGACVDLGLAAMDQTGRSASASDFASFALACADQLPKSDARVDQVRRAAAARLAALVEDASAPLTADDRGDAYGYLVKARKALGDDAGVRAAAEARLALLEQAAATAPDTNAASTFDWARADTYLTLGRGDEAVKFLVAREAELPADYNAAHWLSRVQLSLGRAEEALASIDRALAKVTPARRPRLLEEKIDVLEKLGRRDEAIRVAEELVAHLAELPAAMRRHGADAQAQKRLDALRAR